MPIFKSMDVSEHKIETACNNIPDALASLPAGELLLLECGWLAVKDVPAQTQQNSTPVLLYEGCGCQKVSIKLQMAYTGFMPTSNIFAVLKNIP